MEEKLARNSVPRVNPTRGYFYSTAFLKKQRPQSKNKTNTRISTATTFTSRISTEKSLYDPLKKTPNKMSQITLMQPSDILSSKFPIEQSIKLGSTQTPDSGKIRPFTAFNLRPLSAIPLKSSKIIKSLKETTHTFEDKSSDKSKLQTFKALQKIKRTNVLKPSLISFNQKLRIRSLRLRLNRADHLIGYSYLKELLSENIENENEKKLACLQKTKMHLLHLQEIKEFLQSHQQMIEDPIKFFQEMDSNLNSFKEGSFIFIYCLFVKARIFFTYEDFHRSLACLKSMEVASGKDCYEEFRLYSYLHQGKNYQSLRNFKEALKYYLRSLQISWMLNEKGHELLIYDQIGLVFYYLGKMELARIFHDKMILGKFEKEKEFKEFAVSLYMGALKNSFLKKKLEKTFKKAILGHLLNRNFSYEKPKIVVDQMLNVELKKLESEGKVSNPRHSIGAFLFKNEEFFKKNRQKKVQRLASQNESQINEKRIITHQSFNRNHENFAVVGSNIDKYQKISYRSNKTNQKAVARLLKKLISEINNGLNDFKDFAGMFEKELEFFPEEP